MAVWGALRLVFIVTNLSIVTSFSLQLSSNRNSLQTSSLCYVNPSRMFHRGDNVDSSTKDRILCTILQNKCKRSLSLLSATDNNIDISQVDRLRSDTDSKAFLRDSYMKLGLFLPFLSILIYFLLDLVIKDSNSSSQVSTIQRSTEIISLLLFKRVYLYLWAIETLKNISYQSVNLSSDLGKRFKAVNDEIFYGKYAMSQINDEDTSTSSSQNGAVSVQDKASDDYTEISDQLYASLDNISQSTQIIALPILLSLSLVISFSALFLIPAAESSILPSNIMSISPFVDQASILLRQYMLPALSLLSTAAVCAFFTKNEVSKFLKSFGDIPSKIPAAVLGAAMALTSLNIPPGGPYWPVHNIVNAAITINVSRVLQFPNLKWIIVLLTILMGYDLFFVVGTQQSTDGGVSIMESVAKAKLQTSISYSPTDMYVSSIESGGLSSLDPYNTAMGVWSDIFNLIQSISWKPGLFEVAVDNRVSDALGLGDVVFPGILSGWCLRYDNHRRGSGSDQSLDALESGSSSDSSSSGLDVKDRNALFDGSVLGYGIGCFACEIFQTGGGQPALLYLVPSMLFSILIASRRNNMSIEDMLNFNAASE